MALGFDLHYVLDDHQGEDARTHIEHRREHHSRAKTEPTYGASPYDMGCLVFMPELCRVVWPLKF